MYLKFIEQLKLEFQQKLPGPEAQFKMAPYSRITRLSAFELDNNPKLSATMALFYPVDDQPNILLTLRHSYEGVHSAQVSFPGGKYEASDLSFEHTALRELEEEVGIEDYKVTIIGKLTELYIPPSRFLVHPYVGYTTTAFEFRPDPFEVDQIIELPVSKLMDESIVEEREIYISTRNMKMKTPAFIIDHHMVWGATAMMLGELKEIISRI